MIRLYGEATPKVNWFRWDMYSVTNLKELQEWVKKFDVDFEYHFELSLGMGNLRIKTKDDLSYIIPNGFIIMYFKGVFEAISHKDFNNNFNKIFVF